MFKYQEFDFIVEYVKFVLKRIDFATWEGRFLLKDKKLLAEKCFSPQMVKKFRKNVLLSKLRKCIKNYDILRIYVGDNWDIDTPTYKILDDIFSNLMREDKIIYDVVIYNLVFMGNEIIIHNILDIFAKTKQELEYAEMEKLTLKEKLFASLPSILQYLIKDILEYLKARKDGRKMIVPIEISNYRMTQCINCENLNPSILGLRCKICGCFLKLKTPLSFASCPNHNNCQWSEWKERKEDE